MLCEFSEISAQKWVDRECDPNIQSYPNESWPRSCPEKENSLFLKNLLDAIKSTFVQLLRCLSLHSCFYCILRHCQNNRRAPSCSSTETIEPRIICFFIPEKQFEIKLLDWKTYHLVRSLFHDCGDHSPIYA